MKALKHKNTEKISLEFISCGEKETRGFSRELAKELKGGETLALSGDLGAGKTVFAKGMAEGLGIKKTVTSPTFVVMKIYKINKKQSAIKYLCHVDAYRINHPEELRNVGLPEYLGRKDTICLIEWADKIKKIMPKKRMEIKLMPGKEENERIINIRN